MNDKQIEERNEQFDSAVREQFAGYEPKVPHALWNRISAELDKGEATEESTVIPQYHTKSAFGKWKLAIAAAVILTLTVGTLLYTLNPVNGTKTIQGAVAAEKTSTPVTKAAVVNPVKVAEPKMVATVAKKVQAPVAEKKITETNTATKAVETAVANTTVKQEPSFQEMPIEFAPILSENKPVEVGNIPLASLNFLSTPTSLNDEITVIKSTDKKKKHGKKNEEESTKVILLGKKFESKPDIIYQVPVRF